MMKKRLLQLMLLILVAFMPAAAKCGSVDYSQGADALKDAVDFLAVMTIYTIQVLNAVAMVLAIISAFQIYLKMNLHEGDVTKSMITLVGAILFLFGASIIMPAFFGYESLNFNF